MAFTDATIWNFNDRTSIVACGMQLPAKYVVAEINRIDSEKTDSLVSLIYLLSLVKTR